MGTLTCLEVATGKPRWQFIAARSDDCLVVNGQLESRWPVYNSVLSADGKTIYCAAGRHVEVDGGVSAWALDAEDGSIQQRFRLRLPMNTYAPGLQKLPFRERPQTFRGNRDLTSRNLLLGGVALNSAGMVCLINRRWNGGGSRASGRGYWHNHSSRTDDPQDDGLPDPESPFGSLHPVNFKKWDGQVLHYYEAMYNIPKHRGGTISLASRTTDLMQAKPKPKPKASGGNSDLGAEDDGLDSLLDGLPDM